MRIPYELRLYPKDSTTYANARALVSADLSRTLIKPELEERFEKYLAVLREIYAYTDDYVQGAWEEFEAYYFTAPRHDELHDWLVPLLYRRGVYRAHLVWILDKPGVPMQKLWDIACLNGRCEVIEAVDPDSEVVEYFHKVARTRQGSLPELLHLVTRYGYEQVAERLEEARNSETAASKLLFITQRTL